MLPNIDRKGTHLQTLVDCDLRFLSRSLLSPAVMSCVFGCDESCPCVSLRWLGPPGRSDSTSSKPLNMVRGCGLLGLVRPLLPLLIRPLHYGMLLVIVLFALALPPYLGIYRRFLGVKRCFWRMLDLALRTLFDERNTTGHLKERCGNLSGRFPPRSGSGSGGRGRPICRCLGSTGQYAPGQ